LVDQIEQLLADRTKQNIDHIEGNGSGLVESIRTPGDQSNRILDISLYDDEALASPGPPALSGAPAVEAPPPPLPVQPATKPQ